MPYFERILYVGLREAEFDRVDVCTSDEPQTCEKKYSKLHCAVASVREQNDRDFTFNDTTKECSIYRHKPLFYEARPGCSGYQARYSTIAHDGN